MPRFTDRLTRRWKLVGVIATALLTTLAAANSLVDLAGKLGGSDQLERTSSLVLVDSWVDDAQGFPIVTLKAKNFGTASAYVTAIRVTVDSATVFSNPNCGTERPLSAGARLPIHQRPPIHLVVPRDDIIAADTGKSLDFSLGHDAESSWSLFLLQILASASYDGRTTGEKRLALLAHRPGIEPGYYFEDGNCFFKDIERTTAADERNREALAGFSEADWQVSPRAAGLLTALRARLG